MQVVVLALVSLLMWNQGAVDSVRIVDLRVAAHMAEGSDALLGCSFDLAGEVLYSLKWYKDGKEFFRYVPKAFPVMKSFYAPGVSVDLNRSSENFIALKRLTRESTGVYQCEVKAESPTFTMVSQEKHVMIDLLPTTDPIIYGLQKEYYIGSQVDLNCTTTPSRPEAQLKWLVNGAPAPGSYLQGPYLLIPTNRPFTYQSKLALKFTVNAYHFDQEGAMTLKCQAAIPPLYDQETQYTYYEPLSRTTLSPTTDITKDNATMMDIPIVLLIIQSIFLLLFNSN